MREDPVSDQNITDTLWNEPGISHETLLERLELTDRSDRLHVQYVQLDRLITEGKVSVVRYSSFAPHFDTKFMLFSTLNGRIEIINNKPEDFAGHQIGHVHDPMNLWEKKMDECRD